MKDTDTQWCQTCREPLDYPGSPCVTCTAADRPGPLPKLPTLGPDDLMTGSDPDLLRAELHAIIGAALARTPRSVQTDIGPSEIGTPCARRIGHHLTGTPRQQRHGVGWVPAGGTAVHTMLAEMLVEWNRRAGFTRFLTETRVDVGMIDGKPLRGSADVYDRVTASVIDWKYVGITTLRAVKRDGPTPTYRTQIHCYGAGFVNRGVPVDRVVIAYLPRSGELAEGHWHTEDYDPSIPATAVARANAIATALRLAGPAAIIPTLDMADDCSFCPWRIQTLAGVDSDPMNGCPGVGTPKLSAAERLIA